MTKTRRTSAHPSAQVIDVDVSMPVSLLLVVSTEVVLVAAVDVVHVSSQASAEVMSLLVHEVSAQAVMLPVVGLLEDGVSVAVEGSIEVGEAVTDVVSAVEVSVGSTIIPSGWKHAGSTTVRSKERAEHDRMTGNLPARTR